MDPKLRTPKAAASPPTRPWRRKKNRRVLRWLRNFTLLLTMSAALFSGWFFLTASGNELRYMMADTLITTQHRHWAKYLIGQEGLNRQVAKYMKEFEEMSEVQSTISVNVYTPPAETKQPDKKLVEIEPIEGAKFKGHLLIVRDPKKIRLAVPAKVGKGEKVSSMVKRTGAIAGVNAGGFVDPEWMGNGFQPTGIVISGGKIFYNDGAMNTSTSIVGIDKDGRMVAGKYTPNQMLAMGVQEAVTFTPKFIVDGKGLIPNQASGWGIAPRTCMAQTADGTILFAIIDGRQPHSIGATLYDIQEILLEKGAVIAANLDGGSSTVLVHDNEIINKPASPHGERYLPTAFLVFDEPDSAPIRNIWEGLDISKIDPSKW
ncbi:phosphodiester glycosidase family protein [Paenibacillus hemerocallicola]|uniref:Phosphodiester glycosidase family protein n=1 Tax=Paenibacillus hemerocallicola TaxID=1172614 RepID=A0A5C4SZE7_9BACL|nr:phosphodiester glycosidase family protein [Paenibacillus hemerocallicola]TNJ61865.1 phosphodiester glycosidase family protein [Paenibacillus hemerocallicola]